MALRNMILARTGRGRTVAEAATDVEVLEEAWEEALPPLNVLPGMLERVTAGVPGHSTAEEELFAARAEVVTHAPVLRYSLEDCLMHEAGVEYAGGFWPRSASRPDRLPTGTIGSVPDATYCMRFSSGRYFGHWLTDACATALLARPASTVFLDSRPDWPDTADYARALRLKTRGPEVAHVGMLHLYDDFSQGRLKRARYDEMRRRLCAHLGDRRDDGPPVYLRRGRTGQARAILAEDALCDRLAATGFLILDVASSSWEEKMQRLAGAPVVVSVDESHISHAIFAMRSGAAIVSLIPSDRFTAVHRGISFVVGLRFACLVLSREDEGYRVDPEEVIRTVDLVA